MTAAQGLSGLIFLVLIAMTLGGGWIAASCPRLIRAVAGLALSFVGLAGLFYFLNGPFIALMEILIYVGAVAVAIVFGLMLAPPNQENEGRGIYNIGGAGAFVAAGMLVGLLFALIGQTTWRAATPQVNDGSVAAIGAGLLGPYSMVFELISLLLLVAILGALVVARSGRGTSLN